MKFLLIMTVCSQINAQCLPPMKHDVLYSSHYDCATAGYLNAMGAMRQIGQDLVNRDQVVISFKCESVDEI